MVLCSVSDGRRGEAGIAVAGEGEGAGGGSIVACDAGSLEGTTGSGSAGMVSSVCVSIAISLVSVLADRS